jgi:hypothetical protein
MGFSVPPRSLLGRWALTPPFHPYPLKAQSEFSKGGLFSVALSVSSPRGKTARVYPHPKAKLRGIALYGVRTFLPQLALEAILRPPEVKNRRNLEALSFISKLRQPVGSD